MLKLGMIELGEGNSHPYSWSSIIKADYDEKEMDMDKKIKKRPV